MRRLIGLLVLALLALASHGPAAASGPTAPARPARAGLVPGQYIVTLKAGVRPAGFLASNGIATRFVFDAALNGFSARLSPGQLAALQRSPAVLRVEQDQYITLATTQINAPWNLDRIDQLNLPLSTSYTYTATAPNVHVYVIDSGIETGHPQFSGNASLAYTVTPGAGICVGHGTHVAGTIGASTYGVAKAVKLHDVQVLPCGISSTIAMVISGINWVASNHVNPAVANLSLGGSTTTANSALDSAVTNLVNQGVTVVVSAGNSNANACNYSPSRVPSALTVAASDKNDLRASFSNYGACVDLYAPGVSITSTWLSGGTTTLSGTSQAAAHVAGVAALYLAGNPAATPADVANWIFANAASGVITGNPAGTPNRLLYKASL